MAKMASFTDESSGFRHDLALLTPREREVLDLVSRGLLNKQIAWRLGVSLSTVKGVVSGMMGMLRMQNRVQLALWAHHHRLKIREAGTLVEIGVHPPGCRCASPQCQISLDLKPKAA
jgi:DNA-binding CsgD family transcriptional regulator